jgi:homoserine dehydrogenase
VSRRLQHHPGFEVVAALVRDDSTPREGAPRITTADPVAALAIDAAVVVELLPGIDPARHLVTESLRVGRSVVTANKALLAAHGQELEDIARRHGATLLGSASVGGAVPMLETVARLAADSGIVALRGVVNGTCNFVLDALGAGRSVDEALADARRLGLAEADPRLDLSGQDARDKLVLLCRVAFGGDPDRLLVAGIPKDLHPAPAPRVLRLVAEAKRTARGVDAIVAVVALDPDDPLAHARGEENVLEVRIEGGPPTVVRGPGAGGGPTATAILADLEDLRRRRSLSWIPGAHP